jgi:hypothetical protein
MGFTTHHTFQFLCNTDATAHDYHVDIVGRALKEDIPDIPSDNITLEPETVGRLAYLVEYFLVENIS